MTQYGKQLIVATIMGIAVPSAQAEMGSVDHHPVYDQIKVMDYSLSNSSVTQHLAPELRLRAKEKLQRATVKADSGHYKTASELVRRVGQDIYSMNESAASISGYDSEQVWLNDMVRVMESIFPVAREIAKSKGRGSAQLEAQRVVYEAGLEALNSGDTITAQELIASAYVAVQQQVVALRSGDRLMISLPDQNTQAAWVDAQRRYKDWVYTTQSLIEDYAIDSQDLVKFQQVLNQAQLHYQVAGQHAGGDEWGSAVTALEEAFTLMEDSWRMMGIEI